MEALNLRPTPRLAGYLAIAALGVTVLVAEVGWVAAVVASACGLAALGLALVWQRKPALNDWDALDAALAPHAQAIAFVVCAVVVAGRFWVRLGMANVWAEDGNPFLQGAFQRGWASVFEPYQGYLHVLPRLAAVVLSLAPATYIPEMIQGLSLLAYAWLVSLVARPEYGWLHASTLGRLTVSISLCFVPALHEATGNLANLHWVLFAGTALLLVRDPHEPLTWRTLAFVVLAAFSAGETAALIPLAILRVAWARNASRARLVATIAVLIVLLVSTTATLSLRTHASTAPLPPSTEFAEALEVTVARLHMIQPLAGQEAVTLTSNPRRVLRHGAILALLVGLALWRMRKREREVLLVLGLEAAVILVSIMVWLVRPGAARYVIDHWAQMGRYAFLPNFFGIVVWALVAANLQTRRRVALAMVASVSLVHTAMFLKDRDFQFWPNDERLTAAWRSAAPALEQALRTGEPQRVEIPIAPPGWTFVFDARARR